MTRKLTDQRDSLLYYCDFSALRRAQSNLEARFVLFERERRIAPQDNHRKRAHPHQVTPDFRANVFGGLLYFACCTADHRDNFKYALGYSRASTSLMRIFSFCSFFFLNLLEYEWLKFNWKLLKNLC